MKIKRYSGSLGHSRVTIKTFVHAQDGYAFLNRQTDNTWTPYDGPLPSGTYAFVGQQWVNVKKIDPSALPHV